MRAMFNGARKLRGGVLRFLGVCAFFLSGGAVCWAAELKVPDTLKSTTDQLYKVMTGGVVKTIIAIIFCGACIAYVYNKDNEKVKAKIIAIGVGSILLLAASEIIEMLGNWGS